MTYPELGQSGVEPLIGVLDVIQSQKLRTVIDSLPEPSYRHSARRALLEILAGDEGLLRIELSHDSYVNGNHSENSAELMVYGLRNRDQLSGDYCADWRYPSTTEQTNERQEAFHALITAAAAKGAHHADLNWARRVIEACNRQPKDRYAVAHMLTATVPPEFSGVSQRLSYNRGQRMYTTGLRLVWMIGQDTWESCNSSESAGAASLDSPVSITISKPCTVGLELAVDRRIGLGYGITRFRSGFTDDRGQIINPTDIPDQYQLDSFNEMMATIDNLQSS